MEKISARGIEAEILLFFFLKKQKIEAESPVRRTRHCIDCLYFVYCILYIVYCLLPLYCILYFVFCILYIVYCLLPTAYCLLPIAYCLLPIDVRNYLEFLLFVKIKGRNQIRFLPLIIRLNGGIPIKSVIVYNY